MRLGQQQRQQQQHTFENETGRVQGHSRQTRHREVQRSHRESHAAAQSHTSKVGPRPQVRARCVVRRDQEAAGHRLREKGWAKGAERQSRGPSRIEPSGRARPESNMHTPAGWSGEALHRG